MADSILILAEKLHEYPQLDVIDGGSDSILDDCLNQNDGVLQLLHRYAGRTFCSPGKRLRLDEKSYYPDYMNGTGLDEVWMCCTVPIVTGVIDTRTGKAPFREGEAHVLTPNGQVISLQDLIAADPKAVMGEKIMAVAESLFGADAVDNKTLIDENLPDGWPNRVFAGLEGLSELRHGSVRLVLRTDPTTGAAARKDR